MNTPARLRKIEVKLNQKQRNNLAIWPIYGGLSVDPSLQIRSVVPYEAQILKSKGLPTPICIALNKEKEFLEYLKSE